MNEPAIARGLGFGNISRGRGLTFSANRGQLESFAPPLCAPRFAPGTWLTFDEINRLVPSAPSTPTTAGGTGRGPMDAGGGRGLPRGAGITEQAARALPSRRGQRCGPWLRLLSARCWLPGCSGPRRAAACGIVPSTSLPSGEWGPEGCGGGGLPGLPSAHRGMSIPSIPAPEGVWREAPWPRAVAAVRHPGARSQVGWHRRGSRSPRGARGQSADRHRGAVGPPGMCVGI